MILDATAGNRMMWPNRFNYNTVFLDKEVDLLFPPDIQAVWSHLPFRDGVFECVVFDPPHMWGTLPKFMDNKKNLHGGYYGVFKNEKDMVVSIIKASEEFKRVTNRLCFKWAETKKPLHRILTCFSGWRKIHEYKIRPGMGKRSWRQARGNSFWVTFEKI